MRRLNALMIALLCLAPVGAENLTIHLLHPWASEPNRLNYPLRIVSSEPGWDMGTPMVKEGCNWYSYTFYNTSRTDNGQRIEFVSFIPTATDERANRKDYTRGMTGSQLFMIQIFGNQPATVTEVWITIPDTTKSPILSYVPPPNKRVHFLKPWDLGAPIMQIQGGDTIRMIMDTSRSRCGWFSYRFYCNYSNLKVRFVNSLLGTFYSTGGGGDNTYMDLGLEFAKGDSIWILPTPQPAGPAVISRIFPGVTRSCGSTIQIGAIMRDWDTIHPDFGKFWEKPECQGLHQGLVQKRLGPDGKPVLSPTQTCIRRLDWYYPHRFPSGYTNERCYNLELKTNGEGLFEYDTNAFFPLENFLFLDSANTIPNPYHNGWSNCSFSMELSAEFEYVLGQTFYFRGDDDVWVFIDSQLVVDIGGIHNPEPGAVNLDTLHLTPGKTYSLKLFYAERFCGGSNFRMVTSINLRTSSNLIVNKTINPPGIQQFDMWLLRTIGNLTCSTGGDIKDTIKNPVVDFFIEGPPFPATPPTSLPVGTSYGGITIVGNSTVILDTNALTGLPPGSYLIRYYLRSDHSQGGTIPFTISEIPLDHVDILVDDIPLDTKKDAKVDSIVIGMIENNAEAYAVLRDSSQAYRGHATNPVWTVRDPNVVTVAKSPTIPSRCILTKVKAGRTWLVVNHAPNLKPDSTLVIAYVLPEYPVIVSGVMRDNNADLVPDTLDLTLSDTFKTDQRLDSVLIAYKGLLIRVPGASVTILGKQLRVPVPPSVGIDGRPAGTATIYMTIGSEVKSHSQAFTDGVCPAIIVADVLENDGMNPDVLFLTFSEPLTVGSVVGRQLLLIKQGTTDTLALTITQILGQANDSTFTVQTASTDPKAIAGDRLRLIPGSAGGTLTDTKANKAHDLNRSVIIGFKPGAASIAAAWYLDMNADGILDNVVVRFRRKVDQSEIDFARIYRDPKQFSVSFGLATRLDDSTYRIPVGDTIAQFTDINARINTQGAMDLTIVYKAFPDIPRMSRVADSAAPVIKSARLNPGALTLAGTRGKDTLTVSYSEEVVQPKVGQTDLMPFLLSTKADGLQYAFTLTYAGATAGLYTCRFIVESINNPSVLYAMAGDTIWINPSKVSDVLLNPQSNQKNRRVLLQVDWPRADWNIVIWRNPLYPDSSIGPAFGGGKGTAIIARPTTPVELTQTRSRITIYDPVGNVLKSSPFTPFNGALRFEWRGENKNDRFVGAGAYLALIRITDAGGRDFTKTVRLGVRR